MSDFGGKRNVSLVNLTVLSERLLQENKNLAEQQNKVNNLVDAISCEVRKFNAYDEIIAEWNKS